MGPVDVSEVPAPGDVEVAVWDVGGGHEPPEHPVNPAGSGGFCSRPPCGSYFVSFPGSLSGTVHIPKSGKKPFTSMTFIVA